ncbi:MAG TPA: ABC transporter ATP-binding protein [Pyrinomonadaceae bacterium]
MENIRKFARYFRPYKFNLVVGISCILATMVFSLLTPFLVGLAIDDLLREVTWEKVVYYPLVILGVNLIGDFFLFWQRRLLINMSRYIEYDMRHDFYASLVPQSLDFFQSNRVGDLMARATNDLAAVRQMAGPMILYTLQAVFGVAVALPMLLRISPRLTLLLFITMPLVSITVKYFGGQIHVRFEKIQDFFSQISARAQENITGVRVVRAYAQEESEIEKFQELNREYARRNLGLVKFAAAMRPLLQFFIGVGFVLIFAVGIPMAARGEISAGDFTAFNLYLQRMIWYLIALGYVVNLYQRGTASLKRINELYEIEPSIADAPDSSEQKPIQGEIEFRDLTFSYNRTPVLRNVDLRIEAGQTIAFVGRTGSGKSTLMSLIPRLLEAPDNAVLVDGVSVKKYPLVQLRRSIGFVPQETFLFSDTLAQNIAFGVESASQEEIERAAEIAGLADDIKNFPNGYEQLVGERGITLSGGQKQRTAIARAVLRNPRILILDDALSAVDTLTEERVLHNLREIRQNRTTLIVSHRISTVRDADLICVLENGSIIEQGTHEELLQIGGEYADLYQLQLLEEELAATT